MWQINIMVLKEELLVLKCGNKCYCRDACLTNCSMKGTCSIWQIESGNRTLIQASSKDRSQMVSIVSSDVLLEKFFKSK